MIGTTGSDSGRPSEPTRTARIHLSRFGKLPWFPFEVLIALLMVLSGVRNLIEPEAVLPAAPAVAAYVSPAIYVLGGLAMLAGMWRLWLRLEMAGLVFLVLGVSNTLALSLIYGGPEVLVEFLVFLPVAWSAGTRLYQLLRGRELVQLIPEQR